MAVTVALATMFWVVFLALCVAYVYTSVASYQRAAALTPAVESPAVQTPVPAWRLHENPLGR